MLAIRKQEQGAKNHIDRIISALWCVLGVATLFLYLFATAYGASLFALIVLMMGIGTLTTGLILRDATTKWCGGLAMAASAIFPLLHIIYNEQTSIEILIFAAIFLVMMILPGHILNHKTQPR